MTSLVTTSQNITAVASRPSLYARKIPAGRQTTYDRKFLGLWL